MQGSRKYMIEVPNQGYEVLMPDIKPDIRELSPEEVLQVINMAGEKPFRVGQVFNWIHVKTIQDWSEMTNLGSAAQAKLRETAELTPHKLLQERISRDGTRKYLWGLVDGHAIESVLLQHEGDRTRTRNTLCLSTQVGCPMGCSFCATGQNGYKRNLSAGEIIGQVLDTAYHRKTADPDFKINNLVYMGMGEPLLNLPAVVKSIKILNHKDGQNIGIRRITVSTCGLVPQMEELASNRLDIVLAVSLHAPTNELRNRIMPVNKRFPLEELIPACSRYYNRTGRRVTFEYALIRDFNDGTENAHTLARLLQRVSGSANVNVIPVNTIDNNNCQRPEPNSVRQFVHDLRQQGINAVIREEKGSDIEAACGQLAGKLLNKADSSNRL